MKHALSEIDADLRTASCTVCGPTSIVIRNSAKTNAGRWRCKATMTVYKANRPVQSSNSVQVQYRKYKKEACECVDCPYNANHVFLLDVHHLDEDRSNNDASNLVTLCSWCHRLITYRVCGLQKEKGGWLLTNRPL